MVLTMLMSVCKRSRSDADRSAINYFKDDTEGSSACKEKSLTATISLVGKLKYSQ